MQWLLSGPFKQLTDPGRLIILRADRSTIIFLAYLQPLHFCQYFPNTACAHSLNSTPRGPEPTPVAFHYSSLISQERPRIFELVIIWLGEAGCLIANPPVS